MLRVLHFEAIHEFEYAVDLGLDRDEPLQHLRAKERAI